MRKKLLITIDGPSGAGKSTVARTLATRLGYSYVESGAMYRALALLALGTDTDLNDGIALGRLAATADIHFEQHASGNRVVLNGHDVTEAIRSPEVSRAASSVSVHTEVRKHLVARQRALGRQRGLVMEGRDIGTQVFPDADLKIFLDATLDVRGERRFRDLADQTSEAEVIREMEERDRRDRGRQLSPLVPAKDSIRVDTTNLTAEGVVEEILGLVEKKMAAAGFPGGQSQ